MRAIGLLFITALAGFAAEHDTSTGAMRSPAIRVPRMAPPELRRGDKVVVTVWSGAVQLKFDAETASAGHIGETVIVTTPENGRRFVARVEDVGKVVVKK